MHGVALRRGGRTRFAAYNLLIGSTRPLKSRVFCAAAEELTMTRWLANVQAQFGLLGTALICAACGVVPANAGAHTKCASDTAIARQHARTDFAPSTSGVVPTPSQNTTTKPLAKEARSSDKTMSGERSNVTLDAAEADVAAPTPLVRLGASCALHSLDIQVTDQGGIALDYTAQAGFLERLRSEIRELVRRHNARSTRLARASLQGFFETALTVVAISSDEPRGIRVVLVPPTPDAVADLFANTELYAPDLLPDPEWQADRRRRCGA